MNRLETFFQGPETQFGIFYPTHYLVVIFPGWEEAKSGENVLRSSVFAEQDVIAVQGEEVVQYAREHLQKAGLWTLLMSEVSRLIGTEAIYADQDLAMAEKGCGFLVVHAPNDSQRNLAWQLIAKEGPIVARYYARSGIEVLRGAGADHVQSAAVATGANEADQPLENKPA